MYTYTYVHTFNSSGKSTLVFEIIKAKNQIFDRPPQHVFLFYSQAQPLYENLYNEGIITKMFNTYPKYDKVKDLLLPYKDVGSAIILDDQLSGISDDIARIFFELVWYNVYTYILALVTMIIFLAGSPLQQLLLLT